MNTLPLSRRTLSAAVCALAMISTNSHAETPRERNSFNQGWLFSKDEQKNLQADAAAFDDSAWRKLDLPHDWGVEGPFKQKYPGDTGKLPWWGVGWYRKHFIMPALAPGQRVYLEFDGAMSHSQVWVNGQLVGGWPYGYSSFEVELTPHIKAGDNVVSVRLDNPPDSSRWYPGGGIYRNVWMRTTGPISIPQWGVTVTTPQVSASQATVKVRTEISNATDKAANLSVRTTINGPDGKPVGTAGAEGVNVAAGGKETTDAGAVAIRNPKLWDLKTPNLYTAVTEVLDGGKVVDRAETTFGIRTAEWTADKGFLLNGKRVPVQGVCNHADLGALGSVVNVRGLERQIELLQEMGCNAIRTSHNPPAPELLDLCDRMGMLVMAEAFDCWKLGKTDNDYHKDFPEWHEKDLRNFVRRDRNHPSIVLWSSGNEIPEQSKKELHYISEELRKIMHEEDPTRPVAAGCNHPVAGYNGFQKTVDVFGYNYKPHEYGKVHEANPGLPLFGSETASTVSTRGEYFFPVSENKDDGKADFQVSSYDLYAPRWATTPDTEFAGQDKYPFVAGEFVWTGFDYLGEPTPYGSDVTNLLNFTDPAQQAQMKDQLDKLKKIEVPSRSSYFGILDLAGLKKDRFFLYQSRWRPDLPMAHILPHWNWPERVGQVTPVHVYSSGDEAELFLNGKSLGKQKRKEGEYRFRWNDVKYEPGELRVKVWKKGKAWAEATMATTDKPAAVKLSADRTALGTGGADLSYITIAVADSKGRVVPRTHTPVELSVDGPAEIVAFDNGDPTSHEPFRTSKGKVFNGLAIAIVRALPGPGGKITLKAKSEGLAPAEIALSSSPTAPSQPNQTQNP